MITSPGYASVSNNEKLPVRPRRPVAGLDVARDRGGREDGGSAGLAPPLDRHGHDARALVGGHDDVVPRLILLDVDDLGYGKPSADGYPRYICIDQVDVAGIVIDECESGLGDQRRNHGQ